jgi:AraC-like DNA-binding protein
MQGPAVTERTHTARSTGRVPACSSLPNIPFTRAGSLLPFVGFLNGIGAPTERLLGQAQIRLDTLDDPEALVPLHFAHAFAELAARREGIEALGLRVAQQTSAFELGFLGKMLQRALTVYEYLQIGIRLIGSTTSGSRFWLVREGEHLRFNQFMPGQEGPGRCQGDLYTLMITINMLRRFTNWQWNPDEVCLLPGDDKFLGDRNAFKDARIVTDQPCSSFTIPIYLLQKPIPGQHFPETNITNQHRGPIPRMPVDFLDSLEQLIVMLLSDGYPDARLTAEAAGMSTRTLQRRLTELGLSYSKMVNQTRLRLAAARLMETDLSIAEIAESLGYNDASNFTRAFRCQTGVAPRAYRLNNRQIKAAALPLHIQ